MQIHDVFTQHTVILNSTFVCIINSPSINPAFEESKGIFSNHAKRASIHTALALRNHR